MYMCTCVCVCVCVCVCDLTVNVCPLLFVHITLKGLFLHDDDNEEQLRNFQQVPLGPVCKAPRTPELVRPDMHAYVRMYVLLQTSIQYIYVYACM